MKKTILFILLFVSIITLRAQELIATVNIENETCFSDGSGSVFIDATGGDGNYVYAVVSSGFVVMTSDFITTNIFTSLSAGSYDVYIRDSGGVAGYSESVLTVTIELPEELVSTISVESPFCFGDTGNIVVNVVEGTPPFRVTIFDEVTTVIATMTTNFNDVVFTDLLEGEYTIAIEDPNGCLFEHSAIINDVPLLESTAVLTQENTCQTQGEIRFTNATGGTPPYSYGVNGIYSEDLVKSNLPAGIYSLSVRDANGCESQLSDITIDPLTAYDIEITQVESAVCSGDLGQVSLAISANTPYLGVYSYELFDAITNTSTNIVGTGTGNTITTIAGLEAGNYFAKISLLESPFCDLNSSDFIISAGIPIALSVASINVSCSGSADGSFTLTTSGGSGSYEYSIGGATNFQTSNIFTNLSPGQYTVMVRDLNGCFVDSTAIIEEPDSIVLTSISVLSSGNNASGKIQIGVSGGSEPYQYSINGADNGMSNEFSSLEAGVYEIIVSDANGCESEVFTVTIEQINVDNSIITSTDGILTANYKDAISYQWINVDTRERIAGATNIDYTPTEVGRYQVEMVIDDATIISTKGIQKALGNQTVLSEIIDFNSSILKVEDFTTNSFKVYPNPAVDFITLPTSLINKDYIIYNVLGRLVGKGIITQTKLDLDMFTEGIYFLKVKDYHTTKFIKQ